MMENNTILIKVESDTSQIMEGLKEVENKLDVILRKQKEIAEGLNTMK